MLFTRTVRRSAGRRKVRSLRRKTARAPRTVADTDRMLARRNPERPVMSHLQRAERSLVFGAVVAIALMIDADTKGHAMIAANAARDHTTVTAFLVAGAIGTAVITAAVTFIVSTLASARRPRRRRPGTWR